MPQPSCEDLGASLTIRCGKPDAHLLKDDPVIFSRVRSFNRLVRPRLYQRLKTTCLLKYRKKAYKMGRRLWGLSGRG